MMSSGMFAVFLVIWIFGIILGANNPFYRIALVAAFSMIPYIQVRQLFLLFKTQKEQNGAVERRIDDGDVPGEQRSVAGNDTQ
jgi:succinate dehydrogenase hydrophobic anchor subunit